MNKFTFFLFFLILSAYCSYARPQQPVDEFRARNETIQIVTPATQPLPSSQEVGRTEQETINNLINWVMSFMQSFTKTSLSNISSAGNFIIFFLIFFSFQNNLYYVNI